MLHKYEVKCSNCGMTTVLPVVPEIQAKAKEDFDLAEESAQEKYNDLYLWLRGASIWDLIRYWRSKEE